MIIQGHDLRNRLEEFPLGTMFKCIGHWDKTQYYYEGVIYKVTNNPYHDSRELMCDDVPRDHKDWGYKNRQGNGYSGTWQLITPFEGKELEDYL